MSNFRKSFASIMPKTTTANRNDEVIWTDQTTPTSIADPLSPKLKFKRIKKNGKKGQASVDVTYQNKTSPNYTSNVFHASLEASKYKEKAFLPKLKGNKFSRE